MSCLRNTRTLLVMVALTLSACIQLHSTPCTEGCEPPGQVGVQDPNGGGEFYIIDPGNPPLSACPIDDLVHIRAQTDVWCWASSTQSVMNRYFTLTGQDTVAQWQIADTVFAVALNQAHGEPGMGAVDCRMAVNDYVMKAGETQAMVDRSVGICRPEDGVWPEEVLTRYNFVFDPPRLYPPDDVGVDWPELQTEMCAKRPIISVVRNVYDWTPDGYHTWTIRGAHVLSDGSKFVEYHDPGADGFLVLPFDTWFNGIPNSFTHEVDYLHIQQP
jgi:hypothetical protein